MAVPTTVAVLTECLEDVAKKFKLYMGHMHRALVQKISTDELFHYVNLQEANMSVRILLDYKMKYEPICLFLNQVCNGLDVEVYRGMDQ